MDFKIPNRYDDTLTSICENMDTFNVMHLKYQNKLCRPYNCNSNKGISGAVVNSLPFAAGLVAVVQVSVVGTAVIVEIDRSVVVKVTAVGKYMLSYS